MNFEWNWILWCLVQNVRESFLFYLTKCVSEENNMPTVYVMPDAHSVSSAKHSFQAHV